MKKSKKVLSIVSFAAVLFLLVSFGVFAGGQQEKSNSKSEKGNIWHEAPMLHEQVEAGTLPPLQDRIPKDAMVEEVWEEIGNYGGDWNLIWEGVGDKWLMGMIVEEALFRFAPDGKSVVPNVAKSVDINENSTEFTIHLREGMKWSDGEDFDADDCVFFWEHMLKNGAYGKNVYGYSAFFTMDEKGEKVLCDVKKIDKYTFKITHAKSFPTFLQKMAIDTKWFYAPEHYHRTILPEFIGEEKALEIAKERGFGDLKSFMKHTGYYHWLYPEKPTLSAWKAANLPSESRWVLERNPYYWKTDSEGNQLPYIDRLNVDLTSPDLFTLKGISGEVSCQDFPVSDYTLLMENMKKGDYRVIKWKSTYGTSTTIELNQTVKDPGLRKLFSDINFRAGLSQSINREEINEIVHGGLEVPRQASLLKGLPNYSEKWEKSYAKYDPKAASKYFDKAGLIWDKDKKYRLRPDGSELVMVIHFTTTEPFWEKVVELVKNYWEEAGIRTIVKVVERTFMNEMRDSNDLEIGVWDYGVLDIKLRPDNTLPTRMLNFWAGQYGLYFETGGKKGVKPEGDMLLLLEYYEKMISSTNQDEMNKWADKIVDLHAKNIWIIGTTGAPPKLYVVKNNFRNFPEDMYFCDELRYWGVANPCQFFIKK